MEIFFADDSAQRNCRREGMGPVISVGGVLIEKSKIRPISIEIDKIAAAFGIPKGEELKWSPKRGSWISENLHDKRAECYRHVLQAAAMHEAKAIVVCWDVGRTSQNDEQAFERCLDYLFERLSMNLQDRNSLALMVADRPGGGKAQEDKFLAYFLGRVEKGTEYVLPDRLLLNVLTTPSEMVRHLQLADIVTGVTTAMVAGLEKYAGELFPHVKELFIKNRPGGVAATGLKIAPDGRTANSLVNLYYWVLRENLLHKGGGAIAYRLPDPGFPFAKNGLIA